MALIHRINQKEILSDQIKILGVLMRILARIKEGLSFKEAYCIKIKGKLYKFIICIEYDEDNEEKALMNRLKLRKYLRELSHY